MDDPGFPPSHIEIGDAFQQALKALVVDVPTGADHGTLDEISKASNRVETMMREALASGELRPQVYDRRLDKFLDLPDREKWRKAPGDMLFGLRSCPSSWTNPGPNTGGQPGLVEIELFEAWLKGIQSVAAQANAKLVVRAQEECQRHFEALMRQSPNSRPKKKKELVKQAQEAIRGLSGRAADRAWSNAVTTTGATAWSAAGAPRKSKHR
jgi:hypothetical protein